MALDRGVARGIGDYIRSKTGWIILMDPMQEASMETIRHWQPDGIISSIHIPKIQEISRIKDIPIVGFGSYSEKMDSHLKIPIVSSDQYAIGQMASKHFINKGIKHFAFCGGDEKAAWCAQRQAGFTEGLAEYGHSCEVYEPDWTGATNMPDAIRSLGKWLNNLPKPTGVFVFFDGWARWVLDACILQKINVPQEISVIGVDNDRWLCQLSQPMLSSIDPNVRNAGYKTAELMDQLLQGAGDIPELTYIKPARVEERDSSQYTHFNDPEVAFAIRYIQEHACDPITTADVLKVTGMSNSTAYRKFMKAIGRSIHSEIQRHQIDRIKEMLTTTNLNVGVIAKSAGFENVRYLTQVFRDSTGQTPTEFRRSQSTPEISA